MVRPAVHCESRSSLIRIRNVEDGHGWKVRINSDGDILTQISRLASEPQPLSCAELVRNWLATTCCEGEVAQGAYGGHGFGGRKRSQDFRASTEQRNNPAAQVAIEFYSQD